MEAGGSGCRAGRSAAPRELRDRVPRAGCGRPFPWYTGAMHRALALSFAAAALSCGSARVWTSKPAAGGGVRVEMSSHEYGGEDVKLLLRVVNDTPDTIVFQRSSLRLILPDGTALPPENDDDINFSLMGGLSRYLNVEFEADDVELGEVPGLYLRFDGVYVGETNLAVEPLVIAEPSHGPGARGTHPMPANAVAELRKGRAHAEAAEALAGLKAAATEQPAPAPLPAARSATLQSGPAKVAAMPFQHSEVPEAVAFIIDEMFLAELQNAGFQAIGPDDISSMLGYDRMQSELACNDATCTAELGNALGVPYLAAGSIATVSGTTVMTVKLIDVRDTRVLARVSKLADGGPSILPGIVKAAVSDLVSRSGL